MSQTHLASVPDPSITNRSADRQEAKLWQEPIRSPEIQAEVERIGALEPYVAVGRDPVLFTCLNNWRDRRIAVAMSIRTQVLKYAPSHHANNQTH
jgi:hypothetical protein